MARRRTKKKEAAGASNEAIAEDANPKPAKRGRKVTGTRGAPPKSTLTYYSSWKHLDDLIRNSNVAIDGNDILQINALCLDVIAKYLNKKKK